ncbi:MAG TPA: hypothetical protein VGK23_12100 [Methanomassiliicoccales archaeon]|jgi:hypothetical protein
MEAGRACRFCGKGVQLDAIWCAYCGRSVSGPTETAASQPRTVEIASNVRSPQVSNPKRWLATSLELRRSTDKMIEHRWLFMPLVGTSIVMAGLLVMFFGLMGKSMALEIGVVVYLFGVVVTGGILAQLNFRMLERQDGHARRERVLRDGVLAYMKDQAVLKNSVQAIQPQLSVIENLNAESRATERDMPTLKWTLFSYVPFLQLYVTQRLTRFTVEHDRRWTVFIQQVQSGGSGIGFKPTLPSWKATAPKPAAVYLVISLVFLPFITYWYTDLIKDLEEHFRLQWQFEDQLRAHMK